MYLYLKLYSKMFKIVLIITIQTAMLQDENVMNNMNSGNKSYKIGTSVITEVPLLHTVVDCLCFRAGSVAGISLA